MELRENNTQDGDFQSRSVDFEFTALSLVTGLDNGVQNCCNVTEALPPDEGTLAVLSLPGRNFYTSVLRSVRGSESFILPNM